jgi:hypothetical protein
MLDIEMVQLFVPNKLPLNEASKQTLIQARLS